VDLASVDTTERDGFVVARVRGELDMSNRAEITAALSAAAGDAPAVIVDLGDVGFLDSSALHGLERFHRDVVARGGRCVVVASPGGGVHKLLDVTGLIEVLDVQASVADAVASDPPVAGA